MYFQYYDGNIYSKQPIGTIEINQLLEKIKSEHKPKFDKVATAETIEEKRKLKEKLNFIVVPTISNGKARAYKNIIKFTGVLQLDFDKIPTPEKFRDDLFNEYDFIIASWVSPSKKGVKALANIPISKDVKEYQSYFWGMAVNEMLQYVGFDISPQNAVLPLFISNDPDIRIRQNYSTWTTKGVKPGKHREYFAVKSYKIESKDRYTKASVNNFEKSINSIVDNGHPQVRAAAAVLGGKVGAGYISRFEAFSLAESAISRNAYLSKGTNGYIKTAKEMIQKGERSPLYFDF